MGWLTTAHLDIVFLCSTVATCLFLWIILPSPGDMFLFQEHCLRRANHPGIVRSLSRVMIGWICSLLSTDGSGPHNLNVIRAGWFSHGFLMLLTGFLLLKVKLHASFRDEAMNVLMQGITWRARTRLTLKGFPFQKDFKGVKMFLAETKKSSLRLYVVVYN